MNNIKSFREELGFSMEEFAKKLKMSLSMYEKIEYGYREPSKKFIEKIKNTFPYIDTNIFFKNNVNKYWILIFVFKIRVLYHKSHKVSKNVN